MERYTEITVPELLDFIREKNTENIYFKAWTGDICQLENYKIEIKDVYKKKWFKREVTK